MRHIALRSMSVRNPKNTFTAPGLGDRIHQCTVGWLLSPATLHLTADKWTGGRFANKPESWGEIVSLFPPGSIALQVHDAKGLVETDWLAYLRGKGIEAEGFWYGDHPGPFEPPADIDIAPFFKNIPLLTAEPQNIKLPERFCTVQWDSCDAKRSTPHRKKIEERYRDEGYEIVVVGGEAQDELRWSLKNIAYAMSKAECHAGVDSAFMHMAQLYMPWDRIHLYTGEFLSHHALRAMDNGARINVHA